MVTVTTWYDPEWISPDQAAQVNTALRAELAALAADSEPETGAEAG